MDLPFLLPQSRIFRAFDLTPNLKIRYGADIHIVSVKLRYLGLSQYICSWVIFVILAINLKLSLISISFDLLLPNLILKTDIIFIQ